MFRPNAGSLLNQATPPTVVPTLPSSTLPALPDEDLGKPGPEGAKGQGLAFRSRGRQPVAAGAVAGAAVRSDRPGTRSFGFAQGGGAHYPDLPRTGIFSCPCLPSDTGYCRWRRAYRGTRRQVWCRRNRRVTPTGAAACARHPGCASGNCRPAHRALIARAQPDPARTARRRAGAGGDATRRHGRHVADGHRGGGRPAVQRPTRRRQLRQSLQRPESRDRPAQSQQPARRRRPRQPVADEVERFRRSIRRLPDAGWVSRPDPGGQLLAVQLPAVLRIRAARPEGLRQGVRRSGALPADPVPAPDHERRTRLREQAAERQFGARRTRPTRMRMSSASRSTAWPPPPAARIAIRWRWLPAT